MKLQPFTPVLVAAVTVGVTVSSNQPIHADPIFSSPNAVRYACDASSTPPRTIAILQPPNIGIIPVISWKSQIGSISPLERCQAVSRSFEIYRGKDQLKFITTGIVNNEPVVCASATGSGCLEKGTDPNQGVLFTLTGKNKRDASKALQKLFIVSKQGQFPGAVSSGEIKPLSESSPRTYIDMNAYLENAQVESVDSTTDSSQPQTTTP